METVKLCPKCGNDAVEFEFKVLTRARVVWNVEDETYEVVDDYPTSGLEWDDEDSAYCPACNWSGVVGDIKTPEATPPHRKVLHGKCPTCDHYGDDCTGIDYESTPDYLKPLLEDRK